MKMKKAARLLLVALSALFLLGADNNLDTRRFEKLGHNLICTCGCNQVLLECNHVGCPASDAMRNELTAAMQKDGNNEAVLATFVAKYGPTVLAAPTTKGFDRVAWIMPFVVLTLGLIGAVMVTKAWRQRTTLASATSAPINEDLRARIRQETEE
jgi:cytochrome c-type biogenesis protein CcmH